MAKQAVAVGEGALMVCWIPSPWVKQKSSGNEPEEFIACALTPAGPFSKSDSLISGTNFWSDLQNALLLRER